MFVLMHLIFFIFLLNLLLNITVQKMRFSIKDFFSKYDKKCALNVLLFQEIFNKLALHTICYFINIQKEAVLRNCTVKLMFCNIG